MTQRDIFTAFYTSLTSRFPALTWQQARQEKPSAATWGVITFDGEAPVSLNSSGSKYIYYRIWLYSTGPDETELTNLAEQVVALINDKYITSGAGHKMRFKHIGTSPPFWAEEYQATGVDITFRMTANSI